LGGGSVLARALAAILSVTGSIGCVAFQEPLVKDVPSDVAVPVELTSMHILVRRPQLGDPLPPPLEYLSGLDPHDLLAFQIQDADHIVETLRAIEVFAEVAYGDTVAPTASPHLSIKTYYLPLQPRCDGDQIIALFLTLGLVPAGCTRDLGIYFEVTDRRLPPFLCPWPQSDLVGWFPVLLATGFGNWEREANHGAFLRHVRACISEQAELFGP
jgi:hypothetical protein